MKASIILSIFKNNFGGNGDPVSQYKIRILKMKTKIK